MTLRIAGLSGSTNRPSRTRALVDMALCRAAQALLARLDRAVGQFAPWLGPARMADAA